MTLSPMPFAVSGYVLNQWSPVFIVGDDVTDEDVFVKHRKKIVTVKVGLSLSKAEYYLSNQQEVIKLLEFILKIRSRG